MGGSGFHRLWSLCPAGGAAEPCVLVHASFTPSPPLRAGLLQAHPSSSAEEFQSAPPAVGPSTDPGEVPQGGSCQVWLQAKGQWEQAPGLGEDPQLQPMLTT